MNSLPLPSKTQLPSCSPAPVKTSLLSSVTLSGSPYSKTSTSKSSSSPAKLWITSTLGPDRAPLSPLHIRKPSPAPSPPLWGGQSLCLHLHHIYLLKLHVPNILNSRPPTAANGISWCVSVLHIPFLFLVCQHVKHLIGIISISTTGIKYWIDGLIGFCFTVVQSVFCITIKRKATDKEIFKGKCCMMSSV